MKTKVKYRHYRLPRDISKSSGKPPSEYLWGGWDEYTNPRGGKTECHIELYDDFGTLIGEVVGYAYCSMSDHYNRKTGRDIAYKRANRLARGFLPNE